MPTNTRLLTFLAATSFTTLVACGSSPERGDTKFADLSAEQRAQAIQAAVGGAAVMPYFVVFVADIDSQDASACPAREEDGDRIEYTGGCAATDGTEYSGRMVTRNVPTFAAEGDPDKAMSIEMDEFGVDDVIYDGTLHQSTPLPANGERYTMDLHYTIDAASGALDLEQNADCVMHEDGARCEMGGFMSLPDGSFAIDGDMSLGDDPSGWLELRGVDTLRIDFDAAANGCAPVTIDGEPAGEYCFAEPPPAGGLEFTGGGGGCGGDGTTFSYDLDAWVRGDATRVTVEMIGATVTEDHDLAWVSYDAENDENLWQTSFGDAETDFECGEEITYVFTAYDAEGGSVTFQL